jgi:uncharacterized protein YgiM (DUF1202 family)
MKRIHLLLLIILLQACSPSPNLDGAATATTTPTMNKAPVTQPVSPTPQVARICADWLNVRQDAGVTHPIIASLARGETITVHTYTTTVDGATWAEITSGWVNSKYFCKENP